MLGLSFLFKLHRKQTLLNMSQEFTELAVSYLICDWCCPNLNLYKIFPYDVSEYIELTVTSPVCKWRLPGQKSELQQKICLKQTSASVVTGIKGLE